MSQELKSPDVLSLSVREFVAETAARKPAPGGGSVAGAVGCLSAALAEMALNYTKGKEAFRQHEQFYGALGKRLRRAGQMFEQLVDDDIQAYTLYVEARKMPPGKDKDQSVQLALAASIDVPRELAKVALAALQDMSEFAEKCNPHLLCDLKAGATLAFAAVRLSHYNVQANAGQLDNQQTASELVSGSKADLSKASEILERIVNG